jgi:hypothetical protein
MKGARLLPSPGGGVNANYTPIRAFASRNPKCRPQFSCVLCIAIFAVRFCNVEKLR